MLFNIFGRSSSFVNSQAYLSFPAHIKKNVEKVNQFFVHDRPFCENNQNIDILTSENFAECLASSNVPSVGV